VPADDEPELLEPPDEDDPPPELEPDEPEEEDEELPRGMAWASARAGIARATVTTSEPNVRMDLVITCSRSGSIDGQASCQMLQVYGHLSSIAIAF
jgi:hypothetical protein